MKQRDERHEGEKSQRGPLHHDEGITTSAIKFFHPAPHRSVFDTSKSNGPDLSTVGACFLLEELRLVLGGDGVRSVVDERFFPALRDVFRKQAQVNEKLVEVMST